MLKAASAADSYKVQNAHLRGKKVLDKHDKEKIRRKGGGLHGRRHSGDGEWKLCGFSRNRQAVSRISVSP